MVMPMRAMAMVSNWGESENIGAQTTRGTEESTPLGITFRAGTYPQDLQITAALTTNTSTTFRLET